MEELLEILNDINPDVDYSKEKNLIDGKVYDSSKFSSSDFLSLPG